MNVEEFKDLCHNINIADQRVGDPNKRAFFVAVMVGIHEPNTIPPLHDQFAKNGYKVGVECGKRLK